MKLKEIRSDISKRIELVDFEKLWTGFTQYDFTIYDDEKVYFSDKIIPVDNRFIGNTSIKFEGKQIAIWKVSDSDRENLDLLTASLVHEMFHAHQMSLGEKRFISDLEGLKYPYDIENYKLKYLELKTLASAKRETNIEKKKNLFNKFISIRKEREKLIGTHMIYEKAIETIEGCAEYMTLKVLRVLNIAAYESHLEKACNWISNLDNKLFDIRRISYFSGAILCHVADELDMDFSCEIGKEEKMVFDLINRQIIDYEKEELTLMEQFKIEKLFEAHIKQVKEDINQVLDHSDVQEVSGQFTVRGYDPMNMIKFDNKVLHRSFLGVNDGKNTNFIKGPIVTESEGNNYTNFIKYYLITN